MTDKEFRDNLAYDIETDVLVIRREMELNGFDVIEIERRLASIVRLTKQIREQD